VHIVPGGTYLGCGQRRELGENWGHGGRV